MLDVEPGAIFSMLHSEMRLLFGVFIAQVAPSPETAPLPRHAPSTSS